MRRISILGSTGSIGTQTLEIVDLHSELNVVALSGNKNVDRMYEQCLAYHPEFVAMMDEDSAQELRKRLLEAGDSSIPEVMSGMDGLIKAATLSQVDIVVTAIVGMIGLRPTVAAIEAGKTIALANKETLVTAGEIIMPLAKKHGVSIIPVDSEHSAIYQSIGKTPYERIEKVILTASGGPFRGMKSDQLKTVTKEDALKHPNWSMGAKITIDSSTMMNKGLEVIEAKWLFDLEPEAIDVVIHKESIIHSMVQYIDGSVIAQMGLPDMRLPIQFALFEEERRPMPYERLNLAKIGQLNFEEPDYDTFPCLAIAYEAMKQGDTIPTVMNAANESAVALFLDSRIQYFQIPELINSAITSYKKSHKQDQAPLTIERILEAEQWTTQFLESRW